MDYTSNNTTGSLSYTPVANANGTAQITVTVQDNGGTANGGVDTFSHSFTVIVSPMPDPPVAVDDVGRTNKDTTLNVLAPGVLGNDTDVYLGDTKTVTAVNDEGNVGTLVTLDSGALLTVNADGSYTYDPNGQFEDLEAGQSGTDTFTYEMQDSSGAPDTATVTITVVGCIDPGPVPPRYIDNDEPGFTATPGWTPHKNGWQHDVRFASAGDGTREANWTFTGLRPGDCYEVWATWSHHVNRATDAPFSINGNEPIDVNQELAPKTIIDQEVGWDSLGIGVVDENGEIVVTLSNDANEYVIADGVRIARPREFEEPEIAVTVGTTPLADGGAVDFGTRFSNNGTLTRQFTVTNVGGGSLDLNPIVIPGGFTLEAGFGDTSLGAGEQTTFTVGFNATELGDHSGDVSFGTNDGDENPFNFTVEGTTIDPGNPPPVVAPMIIDNGDPGFTASRGWISHSNGWQHDVVFAPAGNGGAVATWTFEDLTPGATYQVSATWSPHPNRATDAPFSVDGCVNGGPVTIDVDQEVDLKTAIGDDILVDQGVGWKELATCVVDQGGQIVVTLTNDADEYVIADAVRVDRVAPAPEIQVTQGATSVADGGTFGFGTKLSTDGSVERTFTVTNTGTQTLELGTDITFTPPDDAFTLSSGFGDTSLDQGESTTFTIQFDAATLDDYSADVSFVTNDGDENPFNFTLTGTVSEAPIVPIYIDNDQPGFASQGYFPHTHGWNHNVRFAAAGDGSRIATWTFEDLTPDASYDVSLTWKPHENRATDAPFSVNGGDPIDVNQELAPDDFTDRGTDWEHLGNFAADANGQIIVTLTNDANEFVIADGVRVERTQALVVASGENQAGVTLPSLTLTDLEPVVDQVIASWTATGLADAQESSLQDLQVVIADLPAGILGQASTTTIWIDINGAGYGWDIEGQNPEVAESRVDLLHVVTHEVGHVIGLGHDADDPIMSPEYSIPGLDVDASQLDDFFSEEDGLEAVLSI